MNTIMDLKDSLSSETDAKEISPNPETEVQQASQDDKIHLPAAFIQEVEALDTPEKKIDRLFQFLDGSMSANPQRFRDFWEGRKMLLPLLKQMAPTARTTYWERLSLITQEARRKKEELLKESAFAEEQIEMAIASLEQEIASCASRTPSTEELFNPELNLFGENRTFLVEAQGQLQSLNAFAARITSLRKELIRTNIRIRTKNQFFDRLSTLGNAVFPKRKELIQSVSDCFVNEVTQFCDSQKRDLNPRVQLALLREQIKELQRLAKVFTLNTNAFNVTRGALSQLWDLVKEQEKERKKEFSQRKEESHQQKSQFLEELAAIVAKIEAVELTARSAEERLTHLLAQLKRQRLDKIHVRDIKEKILAVKEPIDKLLAAEADAFNQREREKEEKRRSEVVAFMDQLATFQRELPSIDMQLLEERLAYLKKQRLELNCTSTEKRELEQSFKEIQGALADKREEALLNLPSAEKEYLENLLTVKKQRDERRKEVKARLESLRKAKASSGLDFEKALQIDAQEQEEREALEKIIQGIQEIDQKIAAFKSQK